MCCIVGTFRIRSDSFSEFYNGRRTDGTGLICQQFFRGRVGLDFGFLYRAGLGRTVFKMFAGRVGSIFSGPCRPLADGISAYTNALSRNPHSFVLYSVAARRGPRVLATPRVRATLKFKCRKPIAVNTAKRPGCTVTGRRPRRDTVYFFQTTVLKTFTTSNTSTAQSIFTLPSVTSVERYRFFFFLLFVFPLLAHAARHNENTGVRYYLCFGVLGRVQRR